MSSLLRYYLLILFFMVVAWLWWRIPAIISIAPDMDWAIVSGIVLLYIFSHILRLARLILLTLDQRKKSFDFVSAHALTSFPSSLLPFKLGEPLRLAAFFRVCGSYKKAWAVWLVERFGDLVAIVTFIIGLYLFAPPPPRSMRMILGLFVLAIAAGLIGLFAIAKLLIYLNRHLILTSLSRRGLVLLRAGNIVRNLELEIYKSLEGRASGVFLISVLVWVFDISALYLFIDHVSAGQEELSDVFASMLFLNASIGDLELFGIFQSLALGIMGVAFILMILLINHFKKMRV